MSKTKIHGDSIRIRFTERQEKLLYTEKSRTDRSVSDIVRQAVDEYFARQIKPHSRR